jgi:hypothetical protein
MRCSDDLKGTKDLNYVTFEATAIDLGVDIGGTNVREVKLYTTQVSGSDRTYNIKVVTASTTADPQAYEVPETITVPAGSNEGTLAITLSDVNIGDAGKKLVLDIEAKDGLFKGPATTITINQICPFNDVKLNLIFDGYASECTWDLKDASGNVVASGSSYSDGQETASAKFCLQDGSYTFTINDAYGDGLSYPNNGSATISKGTTQLVFIEGDFGSSKSVTFNVSM